MKYNPDFHGAVIMNLRPKVPSPLSSFVSDEEIWNAWEEASTFDCEDDAARVKVFIELLDEHVAAR